MRSRNHFLGIVYAPDEKSAAAAGRTVQDRRGAARAAGRRGGRIGMMIEMARVGITAAGRQVLVERRGGTHGDV